MAFDHQPRWSPVSQSAPETSSLLSPRGFGPLSESEQTDAEPETLIWERKLASGSTEAPPGAGDPSANSGSRPSLQAQLERADRLGHHFSKVSAIPSPASVQPFLQLSPFPDQQNSGPRITRHSVAAELAQFLHTKQDTPSQPQPQSEPISLSDSTVAVVEPAIPSAPATPISIGFPLPQGPFSSEDAALAALKTSGQPGVVLLENGLYQALSLRTGHSFIWPALRWEAGQPWTRVRFTQPNAVAIVTQDGATLRPDRFASLDQARTRGQQEGLMPGAEVDDPAGAYGEAFGNLNQLDQVQFLPVFEAGMKDVALQTLHQAQPQVQAFLEQLSQAQRDPAHLQEIQQTAQHLAQVDAQHSEVEQQLAETRTHQILDDPSGSRYQDSTAWEQEQHPLLEQGEHLQQQRQQLVQQAPILNRIDPQEFLSLSTEEQLQWMQQEAQQILQDIELTREAILAGQLRLWSIPQIPERALVQLGISDPTRQQWVRDQVLRTQVTDAIAQVALSVFQIVLGSLGPLGATMALGVESLRTLQETSEHGVLSAAGNTDLEVDASVVPPDLAGSWGWLVVAWVSLGLEAKQVVKAVRRVAETGSVPEGIRLLAQAKPEEATRLQQAAGGMEQLLQTLDRVESLPEELKEQLRRSETLQVLVWRLREKGGDQEVVAELKRLWQAYQDKLQDERPSRRARITSFEEYLRRRPDIPTRLGRVSEATQRESLRERYAQPSLVAAVESALQRIELSPTLQAVVRRYDKVLEKLEGYGISVEGIVGQLAGQRDAAGIKLLRRELRQAAVEVVERQPSEKRMEVLQELLTVDLDDQILSQWKGQVFSQFAGRNMGDGMATLMPGVNSRKIPGVGRNADRVVQVSGGLELGPPAGKYLAEDKAGPEAFKAAQARAYSQALAEGGGKVTTVDGSVYDGILYFFDTEGSAEAAMRVLEDLDPNIHVAFYNKMGALEWLR